MVPTLETPRLRLRGCRFEDIDAHAAALADPEVMRFIGGEPCSREDAWRRMLIAPGMWSLIGYGVWVVERKEDGRWLGQAGFGDFQRKTEPQVELTPEMAWIFASHAHGQGYASEAVAAAIEWGEKKFPGQPFGAVIDPANAPSIKLAEKFGFKRQQSVKYKGDDILVYVRPPASPA